MPDLDEEKYDDTPIKMINYRSSQFILSTSSSIVKRFGIRPNYLDDYDSFY